MDVIPQKLQNLRNFFDSGATKSYEFRKQKLAALRQSIFQYEGELMQALYDDLKKSSEESWVTEVGFLLAEIRHTLKYLRQWIKPENVSTNLLNLPGKSYIYKEPLGVVLIIAPWNYPMQLLLTPFVGAIAAGNCVVLKPSELAPSTSAVIKKIITQSFLKEHVLYVEGNGAEVVPQLIDGFRFDHIFYTGSTRVGKSIYEQAARQLIPVTLELGGKSPCVVEEDANIKVAARRITVTKFSNAGQMCVAPDYVLVHQSKKEELLTALKSAIVSFYGEDASASYNYGRIINKNHFHRLIAFVQQGKIVYGGKFDEPTYYIEPTILEDVHPDSTVMTEEIFGPVLPLISFKNFEEAKTIINRNPNPLAFYVFTNDKNKEKKWLTEIAFGGGCVNNASWHLTNFNLPFGGKGNSGFGAYHGKYSFDVFTHKKAVMKTPTWFDPAIKYPPFNGKLNLFKKIIR